jgi:hypothetical protein
MNFINYKMEKTKTITMDYSDYLELLKKKQVTIRLEKIENKSISFKLNDNLSHIYDEKRKNEIINNFENFSTLSFDKKQAFLSEMSDYLGVCLLTQGKNYVHVSNENILERELNDKGFVLDEQDRININQWLKSQVEFEEKSELNKQIISLNNEIESLKYNISLLEEIHNSENHFSNDLINLLTITWDKVYYSLNSMNRFQRLLVNLFFRKRKNKLVEIENERRIKKGRILDYFKETENNRYGVFIKNTKYPITLFKKNPNLKKYFR